MLQKSTQRSRSAHPADLVEDEGQAQRREMLATVDRFLVKFYGERCKSASGGCACCIAWAARDMLAVSTFED